MNSERTQIRGKGWKRTSSIASDKFEMVSKAILASLTTSPVTFTRLVERVRARLPRFDGSIAWYTITCARELEVRGQLLRQTWPVLYSRAGKLSAPGPRRRGPAASSRRKRTT